MRTRNLGTIALIPILAVLTLGCEELDTASVDDPTSEVAKITDKKNKETLPRGDEYMAEVMCQEFVSKKLRAPSTAEFNNTQHKVTGKRWFVWGTVSAQNAFGGTVDAPYSCLLDETKRDDYWSAKSVMVGN